MDGMPLPGRKEIDVPDSLLRRSFLLAVLCLLLPTLAAAQVTMTLEEFQQLRSRGLEPLPTVSPPPAPWALESADFAIEAGAGSARLRTTLSLSVFAADWQKVPLGNLGSITDLQPTPGLEARIEGGQVPSLLVRGEGRFTLRIDSVRPLDKDATATRPTSIFQFSPPPAALLRGTLAAPAEVEEVTLAHGGMLTPAGPRKWSFLAGFEPGSALVFGLLGRQVIPERALLPLRYETRILTETVLSRTQLQVSAQVDLTVAQGRLEELWLDLPPGLEVVATEGGPLAGFKAEGGKLHVLPLAPVQDRLRFTVKLRGKSLSAGAAFASPLLSPQGSRRTLQLVSAQLRGDGLLDLVEPGSARAATERDTADFVLAGQARVFALTDPSRPPRFEAVWAEGTEVLAAQIDRLLVDVAVGGSGRAAYQLWAEVRNRGTLSLEVMLPPGFELIAADRDGEMVLPGKSSRGGFEFPLFAGEETQVVHLSGLLPLALPAGKGGDLSLLLPALSAPAARVEARLLLPATYTAALADSSRYQQVGPPPGAPARLERRADLLKSNTIAQQIWSSFAPREQGGFFSLPQGFSLLQAGWSALSSSPAPMLVRLTRKAEVSPWF
jgi:hypothetical protein